MQVLYISHTYTWYVYKTKAKTKGCADIMTSFISYRGYFNIHGWT